MSVFDDTRNKAFRRVLRHVQDSTTDEADAIAPFTAFEFRDAALAELERDRIFGEVPLIVAHSSEVAEPLSFRSVQLPRNNVIVCRQSDGTIRAFVNACRHRGTRLVDEQSGRCRVFSCPYHRWSYNPDGSLRSVTNGNTFGDFDRSQYGLVQLPVEERHGFVWVLDNAERTIDVAAWLGPEVDALLGEYRIADLRSINPYSFDWPSNWKMMQDGFVDVYHVKYLHPNSAGRALHTNVAVVQDFGRHFCMTVPRKSIDQFLEREDLTDVHMGTHVTESCFISPNSLVLKHSTHVEFLTFRPCGADPALATMEIRLFAPTEEESGLSKEDWEALWEKNWKILLSVLEGEDCPILASAQSAMDNQDLGTMHLGRNELANHLFRREVRRLRDSIDSSLSESGGLIA